MGNKVSGCFTTMPQASTGTCGTSELGPDCKMPSQPDEYPDGTIYEYTVKDVKGKDVDLSVYRESGLTEENYTELNQLYQKYKDQGLEILAFPCNQFNAQEPGSNDQIQEFACTRFKTAFPIFNKIKVNGCNTAPLYKFLKLGKWGFFGDDIQWNFAKFLVNKQGKPVGRYYPSTSPLSLQHDINRLLEAS